ncbi:MAG: hypothetical protein ACI8UD_002602 [Planctomycetota bacterium]
MNVFGGSAAAVAVAILTDNVSEMFASDVAFSVSEGICQSRKHHHPLESRIFRLGAALAV